MPHWLEKVRQILEADTDNLLELADISGIPAKILYMNVSFGDADLRGQDISNIELSDAAVINCILDDSQRSDIINDEQVGILSQSPPEFAKKIKKSSQLNAALGKARDLEMKIEILDFGIKENLVDHGTLNTVVIPHDLYNHIIDNFPKYSDFILNNVNYIFVRLLHRDSRDRYNIIDVLKKYDVDISIHESFILFLNIKSVIISSGNKIEIARQYLTDKKLKKRVQRAIITDLIPCFDNLRDVFIFANSVQYKLDIGKDGGFKVAISKVIKRSESIEEIISIIDCVREFDIKLSKSNISHILNISKMLGCETKIIEILRK